MVHVVAGAREKSADIPAKIEDFSTLPDWMTEQFVEVRKLRQARRHEIPGERATVSEERLRRVDESLIVVD
jgi:hypothetical protein